jgi:hypothetical protein
MGKQKPKPLVFVYDEDKLGIMAKEYRLSQERLGAIGFIPQAWRVTQMSTTAQAFGAQAEQCERCGRQLAAGDWPWCKGSPEDHARPHYGWHFAAKD